MSDPASILASLVPFRSDIVGGEERPLADHLAERLRERGADAVIVADAPRPEGPPTSWVYARYGEPTLLVNAHLDTVPPNADWSADPFVPRVEGGRMYALGASDTKGAAAAILAALDDVKPRNVGVLFSGDEEFSSVAMRDFLASEHRAGLERAIVCEPTNLRVGVRHRGIVAFEATVSGPGGHSSMADTLPAPIAILSRLAIALEDWAKPLKTVGPPGFLGMCLNVAKLDGGIAFNVIPAEATLCVSLRPPPGADPKALHAELEAIVRRVTPDAKVRFLRDNVPFATRDVGAFEPLLGASARAPIDLAFWTEAALLSESGVDAVVFGTGDIAQAHAPDEWVSLEELDRARAIFRNVFSVHR